MSISFIYNKKVILSGITMPNLEASFRALRVLHTAKEILFKQYSSTRLVSTELLLSLKLPKATFYNYFHSKERLIEMCLTFQKDGLKEEVFSIIYSYRELMVFDKLKKIFFSACQPRRAVPFTFTGHF